MNTKHAGGKHRRRGCGMAVLAFSMLLFTTAVAVIAHQVS